VNLQADDKAKQESVSVTVKTEEADFATTTSTSPSSPVVDGIQFAATADEARKRMSKKKDVRSTSSMSMKDKYDIFKKM